MAAYSNLGYFLLQEIVTAQATAAFSGLDEYFKVVRSAILEKLKIAARPHAGRLGFENRDPSEVLCQLYEPGVTSSRAHDDGRLTYGPYGVEWTMDAAPGSGFLFAAAVDLARILAALHPATPVPLFTDASKVSSLFLPVGQAGTTSKDPGAPLLWTEGGWNWRWMMNARNGFDLVLSKGGVCSGGSGWVGIWNPHGPLENVISLSLCVNVYEDVLIESLGRIQGYFDEISKNMAWPSGDLFKEVLDE